MWPSNNIKKWWSFTWWLIVTTRNCCIQYRRVFTGWHESPTTFFVQALTSKPQFELITNELSFAYVNKTPTNGSNSIAGTLIAIYTRDDADIVKWNNTYNYTIIMVNSLTLLMKVLVNKIKYSKLIKYLWYYWNKLSDVV